MVGGAIRRSDSRERRRVSVLHTELESFTRNKKPQRKNCALTTPSSLSRSTRANSLATRAGGAEQKRTGLKTRRYIWPTDVRREHDESCPTRGDGEGAGLKPGAYTNGFGPRALQGVQAKDCSTLVACDAAGPIGRSARAGKAAGAQS
jgi:hypothetical protein